MISFDVKALFTNISLEKTIDIILKKIYDDKKTETNIPQNIMKDLLYFYKKQAHFTYGGKIYIQIDGGSYGITVRPTVRKHGYDISRENHVTIH